MKIGRILKIYNNITTPHLLNFPINCYGKIYKGKYYLKLRNLVIEFGWNIL